MKLFAYLISIGIAIVIGGCALREPQAKTSEMAPAQVGIVNHTGNYIYFASVDGAGGGGMSRWGAGVADICCASIPSVWYPGMKVLVRWDMPEGHKHIVKEKVVEVEKYNETGSIYIHFFPNDEVRVVVTPVGPYNPAHPIRHLGNPNEASPVIEASPVLSNLRDSQLDLLAADSPAECHARVARHLLVAGANGIHAEW